MPRGDGTGPLGKGPRTGKGQGKCSSKRNKSSGTLLNDIAQGTKKERKPANNRIGRGQGSGQGSGIENRQN